MNCAKSKLFIFFLVLLAFGVVINASSGHYRAYSAVNTDKKVIALTFDDGPHGTYTPQILDILAENGVRATFFTVGENVTRFPELIDRELSEGHEVANHTYSHKHMAKLREGELINEILKCENSLFTHDEYVPRLFRPPEGILSDENSEIIARLGYDIVLWSIDTRDWSHTPVNTIVKNVIGHVDNGAIILFHDFIAKPSPTPEALKILIPRLKELGYEFVTVSELINNNKG